MDTDAADKEPEEEEEPEEENEGEGHFLVFFDPATGKMAKMPRPRGFELGIVYTENDEDYLEGEVESPAEQKDLFFLVMEAMWKGSKK